MNAGDALLNDEGHGGPRAARACCRDGDAETQRAREKSDYPKPNSSINLIVVPGTQYPRPSPSSNCFKVCSY